jgi:hypothetical protein
MFINDRRALLKIDEIVRLNRTKLKYSTHELGLPHILDHGVIILQNFAEDRIIICGYYIIPKYDCNLYQYLQNFRGPSILREFFAIAQ